MPCAERWRWLAGKRGAQGHRGARGWVWHLQEKQQTQIKGAITLSSVVPYRAKARLFPLSSPLTGLHSQCSRLTAPEHAWVAWFMVWDLKFLLSFFSSFNNIFKLLSGISDLKDCLGFFHGPLSVLFVVVCLNLRWIPLKQSQRCQHSVPMLVHVHAYHAEVHLFQLCQGWQSVPCLSTEQSAHTSQTNWTLGVTCAQARCGLPSVRASLAAFTLTLFGSVKSNPSAFLG